MLFLLAATNSPALENDLSDGTDVPDVTGRCTWYRCAKIHHV